MSCVCVSLCLFFFKQKTAYEMRISDWSSDVCSSDLQMRNSSSRSFAAAPPVNSTVHSGRRDQTSLNRPSEAARAPSASMTDRSEEHTSELQSLMRISYAVFCLKKKIKNTENTHYNKHTHTTNSRETQT